MMEAKYIIFGILILMVIGIILISDYVIELQNQINNLNKEKEDLQTQIGEIKKNEEKEASYGYHRMVGYAVKLNRPFNITLDCNPTTGFEHVIKETDNNSLKLINSGFESSSAEPCTGCGGTCYYEFQPLKEGNATLTFYYCQPWQCEETLFEVNKYIFDIWS